MMAFPSAGIPQSMRPPVIPPAMAPLMAPVIGPAAIIGPMPGMTKAPAPNNKPPIPPSVLPVSVPSRISSSSESLPD